MVVGVFEVGESNDLPGGQVQVVDRVPDLLECGSLIVDQDRVRRVDVAKSRSACLQADADIATGMEVSLVVSPDIEYVERDIKWQAPMSPEVFRYESMCPSIPSRHGADAGIGSSKNPGSRRFPHG